MKHESCITLITVRPREPVKPFARQGSESSQTHLNTAFGSSQQEVRGGIMGNKAEQDGPFIFQMLAVWFSAAAQQDVEPQRSGLVHRCFNKTSVNLKNICSL